MKLIKKGLILIISTWLFSCSEDITRYSCDPEVDKYVIENFTVLKSVNVSELSTYSDELQRAAYRSFSPMKKYEIWVEKLKILSTDETFTIEEQQHIFELQTHLTSELFDSENISAYAAFISFYNSWEKKAYTELNWDKTLLTFVTSSLNIYYDDFLTTSPLVVPAALNGNDCYCNQSSDGCPTGSHCASTVCTVDTSPDGCGILWLEECNGACFSND